MSNNAFDFEQTGVMRAALDMVVGHLGGQADEQRRTEIARLILTIAAEGDCDATTLVKGTAGKVTLVASFATKDAAEEAIAQIAAEKNPRLEEIIGDAWRDEWKKHFHPFLLCDGLVVAPPWEKYDGGSGDARVLLRIEQSFDP